MIVWVNKDAVGENCNQKAKVDRTDGQKIFITLLGNDEQAMIFPNEIVGLELSEELEISFNVTKTKIKKFRVFR